MSARSMSLVMLALAVGRVSPQTTSSTQGMSGRQPLPFVLSCTRLSCGRHLPGVVPSMGLRGGFDVWGEDGASGDDDGEGGVDNRASAVEVRQAARKAAAAAAAFKKATASKPTMYSAAKTEKRGRLTNSPTREDKSESDAGQELNSMMARHTIDSGAPTEQVDAAAQVEEHSEGGADDFEGGSQRGEEGEGEDEDHDGYDDVGWGEQKPVLGKDVIGLLDLSDMSENAEWVDHLSSGDASDDRRTAGGSEEGQENSGNRAGAEDGTRQNEDGDGQFHQGGERVGIDQEKMLDDGADIFFPNPKWIRKEFLQKYVEPYIADGRHKMGLKGALRNLKELLAAGAVSEAQYKTMKASMKRQDSGADGAAEEAEDYDNAQNGPEIVGTGGGEAARTDRVPGLNGRRDKAKKGKGKAPLQQRQRGSGAVSVGAADLVPLSQIHLPSDGQCNMDGSADAHYRYKMPAVEVKVEGTTKMIRTVLTNMVELAAAVGRPPSYLVTYLGQECSAMSQTAKVERDGPNAKPWLSGKHAQPDLQLLIFKFIRECVLCPKCNNPETAVSITGKRKKRVVVLTCGACGASSEVPPATKFAKWMALRPPTEDTSWGRITAKSGEVNRELENGEGELGAGSGREAHTGRESGGAEGLSARRGQGGDEELKSLDGISAYKMREALRVKALRQEGSITEDEYGALKQQIKDRCKAAKAALAKG